VEAYVLANLPPGEFGFRFETDVDTAINSRVSEHTDITSPQMSSDVRYWSNLSDFN
jgi:hypothetical protein